MNEKQGMRKHWLDIARTFAILFVTFNHAANRGFSYHPYEEYLTRPHIISWLHAMFNVISRLGVPIFLMITGALLLKRNFNDKKVVVRFLKHNLLSIFITAEIWYAIMYWYIVLTTKPEFVSQGVLVIIGRFILNQLFINQVTMNSMWYMSMILVVYLAIPFLAIVVQKFPSNYIWLCLSVLISSSMIVPNLNTLMSLLGINFTIEFSLTSDNLLSMFVIYILIGYYISEKVGNNISMAVLIPLFVLSLVGLIQYQYWAFSHSDPYIIKYDSIGILIVSTLLFEIIRRIQLNDACNNVFRYISERAFGIYFVHVCVMVGVDYLFIKNSGCNEVVMFLILDLVSITTSMVIIAVLERIPLFKRYLFMIK